ncbi:MULTISPECIES: response regulator [Arcicella]|uniref:Response regulator n=1 Tax=Arcicella lustrica TaxID=2984196 RepID=A0ABU5SEP5_9BACT|nr:response regulator [Arcicella sp. DC25W]MEA5425764.1 response regulator [Arcicella sp. DC25W]|eukprot:Opistho-1_new@34582
MKNVALIIDDEKDTCLLLKHFLKRKGIYSYYALTLQEGIGKALEVKPNWLFLDNNLPDGFGIDRVKEIKSLSPNSKIIMISAMGNLFELASSVGADSFIEKPLDFNKIEKSMAL